MTSAGDQSDDALERLLADGFERLSPRGSPRWITEDAFLRLAETRAATERLLDHVRGMLAALNPSADPELASGLVRIRPWPGLDEASGRPSGQRRRSGRDAALADVADLVAADSRAVIGEVAAALTAMVGGTDARVADLAADTIRVVSSLVARVELLEGRTGIVDELFPVPPGADADTDLSSAAASLASWFTLPEAGGEVVHADVGDGTVLRALVSALDPGRWRVVAGDPRADRAAPACAVDGGEVRLATGAELVAGAGRRSLAGVVLAGCVERVAVADALVLVRGATEALAPGGRLALLVTGNGPLAPAQWSRALEHLGLRDVRVEGAGGDQVSAVTGVAW
ncbi:MAG: hypothetical protein M0007_06370 [Actinomycetota bacterium]|jgi:hypothetical protein|nr:hypothetical protein [Actinomycetota bacterium]